MNAIRNNGVKAVVDKVLLLGTEAVQLLSCASLCYWIFANIFL